MFTVTASPLLGAASVDVIVKLALSPSVATSPPPAMVTSGIVLEVTVRPGKLAARLPAASLILLFPVVVGCV